MGEGQGTHLPPPPGETVCRQISEYRDRRQVPVRQETGPCKTEDRSVAEHSFPDVLGQKKKDDIFGPQKCF